MLFKKALTAFKVETEAESIGFRLQKKKLNRYGIVRGIGIHNMGL